MATKTVRVSDLSGKEIPDEQAGSRLVVEHPDYPEPIGLDVVPEDVQPYITEELTRFVVLSYEDPATPEPQRFILLLEEFEKIFPQQDSEATLQQALKTQQEEQQRRSRRRGRQQQTERKPRVDYTSPEHAGEPHRGRITDAEKEYVQNNLEQVNERLARDGHRPIDPNDPEMGARYGVAPTFDRENES